MNIELKELTPQLESACIRMQLNADQDGFVDPPGETLEIVEKYKKSIPLVITNDGDPVGLVIYEGLNRENTDFLIWGFMIDREHQQKGYGTAAMEMLMEKLRTDYSCTRIEIAYVKENEVVQRMYRYLGFNDTGRINDDGERIMEWVYDPEWN